jgi:hypothetical protein
MALAASMPRSLWGVYLRASQAFPLALIHRAQDNKTQNNTTTTTKQAVEKNQNNKKKWIRRWNCPWDVTFAGSGK